MSSDSSAAAAVDTSATTKPNAELDGKRPQFGNRYLSDQSQVFKHNAWDDVEWDEEQLENAKEMVAKNSATKVDEKQKELYETQAGQHWDNFYGIHNNRFFKDRNWLFTEFPELTSTAKEGDDEEGGTNILEVGCGVGNTVFPILEAIKSDGLKMFCCDFSPKAVQLVREHDDFSPGRCVPFVCDATCADSWADSPLAPDSLDFVLLIFALSAMEPAGMEVAVRHIHKYLKPGGLVLFRDYGRYDLAQLRFKPGKCLDENFYVRGDGTRCYFFDEQDVRTLFECHGFDEVQNKVDRRLQVNRGKQLKMYRVWRQAKFRKSVK